MEKGQVIPMLGEALEIGDAPDPAPTYLIQRAHLVEAGAEAGTVRSKNSARKCVSLQHGLSPPGTPEVPRGVTLMAGGH